MTRIGRLSKKAKQFEKSTARVWLVYTVWKPNVATIRCKKILQATLIRRCKPIFLYMSSIYTKCKSISNPFLVKQSAMTTSSSVSSHVMITALAGLSLSPCTPLSLLKRSPQEWWHIRTNNEQGYTHRTGE